MASSSPPAPLLLLLLLLLVASAAAQQIQQPGTTNATDAALLHQVFRKWGLEVGATLPATWDPCQIFKLVAGEASVARNASVGCGGCNNSKMDCRVTHLNVTGYRNITDIPPELFNLTELVSLDLSNNNLSGSIPPGIVNLTKLKTWHFNNNQLSGVFPNVSSGLSNLQSLWMFDNYIGGPFPEFIANFTNLTDLRMHGLKLQGSIPKQFSNLINLEILMLADLDGGNSFDFIANSTNLSILSLRKCGIIGELPSTLPALPNLRYLDLRSNNLSGPIERLWLAYGNLRYLYVGGNNFSGTLTTGNIKPLLTLDISYNPLVNGSLLDNQNLPINYIGTSINTSRTLNSGNLTPPDCLHVKECNINYYTNVITSLAVNCGGNQMSGVSLPVTFYDDTSDLGAAAFQVNTDRQWVVSHVSSVPLSNSWRSSSGIVSTRANILGTDMPGLYQTARTSTGDLWYYAVGLSKGKYTVQLFFAEIVLNTQLDNETGRRLFNIDIQGENIWTDFNIIKEAGGPNRSTNITHNVTVDNSVLKIHLYWNGRGTCYIPYEGAYGPLISAIRVFRAENSTSSPPPARPNSAQHDLKRRGLVAGIAALCIAAAVISSSVLYLWWKWVSLVKYPNA